MERWHDHAIPDEAIGFTPHRFMPNDNLRSYEGVDFNADNPAGSVRMFCNRLAVFGGIAKSELDQAGILDITDDEGDIIADIPLTKKGLRYLTRTFKLKIDKY